jgi:hypothetical protein
LRLPAIGDVTAVAQPLTEPALRPLSADETQPFRGYSSEIHVLMICTYLGA